MPWRDDPEAYKVWVSEIMLQQTRVDQATPFYNRFIERFPTVFDLAEAEQQDVLKAWEGLGYYSRARNLHQAAKTIVNDFNGKLPSHYDDLIKLKGIGPYTAAAISSIVFKQVKAVVDGNVIRLVTRFTGIKEDVRLQDTKNRVQDFVDNEISADLPGDFNQAMMEMGAVVCTPRNPLCDNCPLQVHCVAYQKAQTDTIPYKSKGKKKPHHHIAVGIIERENNELLIALRPNDAMLGGLWEFPGGKQEANEDIRDTVIRELREELGVDVKITKPFMNLKHVYSHFSITLHAFMCTIEKGIPKPNSSQQIKWVKRSELADYPFPKANKVLTEGLMEQGQQQMDL